MKTVWPLAAASIAALLVGCATPYQPLGLAGGFSEVQIDTNVYQVTFKGNNRSSPEHVADMALMRSADLAAQKGFTHFIIVDTRERNEVGGTIVPGYSTSTFRGSSYGNQIRGSSSGFSFGGGVIPTSKPGSSNTVLMFPERPEGQGQVYDVKLICDSLGTRLNVKCGAKS